MPFKVSVPTEGAQIPIIDISSLNDEVAAELLVAASSYGFVFIKNTENVIPAKAIAEMFGMSRDFFQLPAESKGEYSINSSKSGKNRGWLSVNTETLDPGKQKRGDFKEAFNIGEYAGGNANQPLPPPFQSKEERIGEFMESCHRLCIDVQRVIAMALRIKPEDGGRDWFTARHDRSKGPSGSVLRLLYYPALPETTDYNSELDIRAGAHSDYGSVTLLFQLPGQPGLEVLTAKGTWTPVQVNPANEAVLPILVNIGDLLSYWTNGLLKSTVHRVTFPKDAKRGGEDRYSIAYFCHPLDEARLEPIPSDVVQSYSTDAVAAGGAMTAKEHLESRLAATYGLKKEEQQS